MMKAKIPGFLEKLFNREKFDTVFDFQNNIVKVKSSQHNMIAIAQKMESLLQQNMEQLKEAYYVDLKAKFPAKLMVDMKDMSIHLKIKDGLSFYSSFLTSFFHNTLQSANQKNFGQKTQLKNAANVGALEDFFSKSGFKKDKKNDTWEKEILSAEALHIVFNQINSVLDITSNLDSHIKSWKDYFKES